MMLVSALAFAGAPQVEGPTQHPAQPGDPVACAADEDGAPPPPEAARPPRKGEWEIHVAAGGTFVFGLGYSAMGPALRFGGWITRWFGNFMIGGGPALNYSLLFDPKYGDRVHLATINGDLIIGGGKYRKVAGFGHIVLGGGLLFAYDAQTDQSFFFPGIRAALGGGVRGWLTQRISLGGLVDFGVIGGLGVDAYLTLGVHF